MYVERFLLYRQSKNFTACFSMRGEGQLIYKLLQYAPDMPSQYSNTHSTIDGIPGLK